MRVRFILICIVNLKLVSADGSLCLALDGKSEGETARLAPANVAVVLFVLLGFYSDSMKMDTVLPLPPTVQD